MINLKFFEYIQKIEKRGKMFSIIVAVGKNNEIGKENRLLWHIPEDLKNFKKITDGKMVVMGRKTYESSSFCREETNS